MRCLIIGASSLLDRYELLQHTRSNSHTKYLRFIISSRRTRFICQRPAKLLASRESLKETVLLLYVEEEQQYPDKLIALVCRLDGGIIKIIRSTESSTDWLNSELNDCLNCCWIIISNGHPIDSISSFIRAIKASRG